MNFGQIARLLAAFLLFFSLFLVVPFVVSFYETSMLGLDTSLAFGVALATGLIISGLLWLAGMQSRKDLFRREGLAVVVLSWVIAAAIAAIPFKWSGAIPDSVDAFFESMSGITTTGATVLGTAEHHTIESLPASILLWRAMLQWIGGIGIVLVFIVLLPAMGITGSRLLSSEQVGMSDELNRPRLGSQARRIMLIYVALTAAAGIGYWIADLSVFDALCHALTTSASGGFSNNNVSIGGYKSLGVEIVAIVFMFLAGCNFLFLLRTVTRGGGKAPSLLQSIEFRVYAGITVLVALTVTMSLWMWGQQIQDPITGIWHDYREFGRCLRDATFETVSTLTSTGYASTNFVGWPKITLCLLLVCMFIGGCTGSTSGGFKVLRIVVCGKLLGYALRHFVRPRSVETLKLGSTPLANHVVSAILTLLLLWIVMVVGGTLILNLDTELDMVSAFAASISMMGCMGPSVSPAGSPIDLGPYGGYGLLQDSAKMFMTLQMLFGRLEILAPLALLTPGFWRR